MSGVPNELIVCSLERWDDVWRRNQFLVDGLVRRHPSLRVLFVEPAHDLVHGALNGRLPNRPRLHLIGNSGRLRAFQPVKPLPRRLVGSLADRALWSQVRRAASTVGLKEPALWVNDTAYAPLIAATGWPSLYDVTDDWLLTDVPERELSRRQRLEEVALRDADEVVVCSPQLAATRGADRDVTLIPNGVDLDHMRRPQPRPGDLPAGPVAVYVGTLHDERVDVDLVVDLARGMRHLHMVLVGPDSLTDRSCTRLDAEPNVVRTGPRPYADVPAYLQHADVVIIPHLVTPFTDSLDPIKAYECLAVGTPTVATEVAGFRGLGGNIVTAPRSRYTEAVAEVLAAPPVSTAEPADDISWHSRAIAFEVVLRRASQGRQHRKVGL